ncbi:MAG TPA: complex I subunit 1 family protein [Candidatus Methylacidiphilales bacterium]|nr:complex I subunit 1 family protein [Candidatus Methylacidiphilales bacterium]
MTTTPLLFADLPASIPGWVPDVFASVIKIAVVINVVLGLVSYAVLAERWISAAIQDRLGPNRVGIPLGGVQIGKFMIPKWTWWGLGQPLPDALKFMLKEQFTPANVNKFYYWLAPALAMVPALLTICVIPVASTHPVMLPWGYELKSPGVIADVGVGVLLVFSIASLSVYGIVLAGWASNSKYPFLGGIRSSAQMISYEVAMGLSVIPVFLVTGNLRLSEVINYQVNNGWLALPFLAWKLPWHNLGSYLLWIPMLISFLIFLISAFAETNRLPFDLPESETELVGGYHTEYSAMKFALFFLGEYAAMIVACSLMVTLFFGGWSLPLPFYMAWQDQWWSIPIYAIVFLVKLSLFIGFFIWVRWTLPRFRYDQLMGLGWKCILPIALGNIMLTGLLLAFVGSAS